MMNRTFLVVLIGPVLGLGLAVLLNYKNISDRSRQTRQPKTVNASVKSVIGTQPVFKGDDASPFVLVEFMDYQCPPCKKMDKIFNEQLPRFKGRLKWTVRNYPLSMHPFAQQSAVFAEAAREQGMFWKVHNALLERASLDDQALREISTGLGLDSQKVKRSIATTASKRVESDKADTKAFKLEGTPSLLLCRPDGKVIQIFSIEQLESQLNHTTEK